MYWPPKTSLAELGARGCINNGVFKTPLVCGNLMLGRLTSAEWAFSSQTRPLPINSWQSLWFHSKRKKKFKKRCCIIKGVDSDTILKHVKPAGAQFQCQNDLSAKILGALWRTEKGFSWIAIHGQDLCWTCMLLLLTTYMHTVCVHAVYQGSQHAQ